jgi:uncharacterized protein
MEIFLIIAGFVAILTGLAGAVLPLPGPPLSFAGLIILQYSEKFDFSETTLTLFGIATVLIFVFDYYAPIWGTKKFGGTKQGSWGSTIGLVAGLFLTPIGMFLGAFLGAFAGELYAGTPTDKAFKAAVGSFIGLMVGIVGKVVVCLSMLITAVGGLF